MTTYNDIATKQDRLFQIKARTTLGNEKYMELVPLARKAFEEGMKEPNQIKRKNTARRMANMVFTKAMADKTNGR